MLFSNTHLSIRNQKINSIKSCHIKFDANTILSRLFSWKLIKNLRSISAYGRGFPLGKVFGYHIKYKNLNIVNFGSLCSENIGELNQYDDCDILLIPYAGNSTKHLTEKTLALLDTMKPKIVIPHHWDDFFPPISRMEDLDPLIKQIKEKYPEINVIRLPFEKKKKILSSNAVLN